MQTGPRPAAVAGFFYPLEKQALLGEIDRCFQDAEIGPGTSPPSSSNSVDEPETKLTRRTALECFVVPHAGYAYSGPVAAHVYSKVRSIFRGTKFAAIILGPNHYGVGSGIALSPSAEWETPLNRIDVDQRISEAIQSNSDLIDIDALAHSREHSIEVQVPFLQASSGGGLTGIVPISLMLQDKESMEEVADAIYGYVESKKDHNHSLLILGSSDLTHYEPQERAKEQDRKLIREIESLDVGSFYTILERNDISACGYGAVAVAMLIAKKLGKKRGQVLKYATSGDVTGEKNSVVGYSSVHFS